MGRAVVDAHGDVIADIVCEERGSGGRRGAEVVGVGIGVEVGRGELDGVLGVCMNAVDEEEEAEEASESGEGSGVVTVGVLGTV